MNESLATDNPATKDQVLAYYNAEYFSRDSIIQKCRNLDNISITFNGSQGFGEYGEEIYDMVDKLLSAVKEKQNNTEVKVEDVSREDTLEY